MPPRYPSISRLLALLALIVFAITAFLAFESTETTMAHLIGGIALGLVFIAGATVA